MCRGDAEHPGRRRAGRASGDGRQVVRPLCCPATARADGRGSAWPAAVDHGGSGGAGDRGAAGGDAAGRDPLVSETARRQVRLSQSTIGRIWRNFGLEAHLTDTFKGSTDPLVVEKVVDIVGLYHHPPERAVVLWVDEKSQIQALDRSQPVLPMLASMPERRTHDDERNGITSLFAAFTIADGTVIGELHRQHRATEFKQFLTTIDKTVPQDLGVHVICDNYGTHKTPTIKAWLARHPRFHLHFTPTGSSWINQVERWFGFLTDQMIRRGVHKSVQALERDIRAWVADWNQHPRPFIWTKTAEEILESLARYCRRISGAGH